MNVRLASTTALALIFNLVAANCFVLGADDPYRRAPLFEGKTIPDPPEQGRPWTPPTSLLPKFLISSTASLFEQGVADPRGCEYRRVEVGEGSIRKVRGFVLPERPDIPGRFAISWDGIIYPALTVGEPLDLDKDVRELAVQIKAAREAGAANPNRFGGNGVSWSFVRDQPNYFRPDSLNDRSPFKLVLLIRLGRVDLAEALFAAGTTWTPEPRARDLTDYGISYLTLANDWASTAFGRLAAAHTRGDDAIALDLARRLSKFRDQAEARADFLGFPKSSNQGGQMRNTPPARFPYLNQLDALLADHERRAKMPARTPIPKSGGDPSARIAALIRDLDLIDEQQMMSPGMANPSGSWLVKELIKEGDPAVGPLLEVLESDNRLTRSASHGRGMSIDQTIHPVSEAAAGALIGILQTNEFNNQRYQLRNADLAARKALARSIREFWEKTRAIPVVDRWYQTLLDDSAGTDRWLEAASAINSPSDPMRTAKPPAGEPPNPMRGESLRVGRDPSVTDLLVRRIKDIRRLGNPNSFPDIGLYRACQMGLTLNHWDEKASLPTLKALMTACLERAERQSGASSQSQPDPGLVSSIVQFTTIRSKLGDSEALDDYAGWIREASPKSLDHNTMEAFGPLLLEPDRPSLASAVRWLFNDPKSPWVPLPAKSLTATTFPIDSMLSSSLIILPGFREAVMAGLADRSPFGTVAKDSRELPQAKTNEGRPISVNTAGFDPAEIPDRRPIPFRTCDFVAWRLGGLEGSPKTELFWPEARRDESVARCQEYLKRYAGLFSIKSPNGQPDFPQPRVHLRFPTLQKPATAEDVANLRAIFSLEGQGEEVRPIALPSLPIKANWVILKDTPVDMIRANNVRTRGYSTEGWVYQAEEVRKGDTWERYYGFVGNHVVARAPASEIELTGEGYLWGYYEGGLCGLARTIREGAKPYRPGEPIPVALQIRNRRGVERPSPTEFLRAGADGRPELRKGVEVLLTFAPRSPIGSSIMQYRAGDDVPPRRPIGHFEPGPGSRTLGTLESFEALRFDVNDWFDATRPGQYQLRFRFSADSGVGEGFAGTAYFAVGDD